MNRTAIEIPVRKIRLDCRADEDMRPQYSLVLVPPEGMRPLHLPWGEVSAQLREMTGRTTPSETVKHLQNMTDQEVYLAIPTDGAMRTPFLGIRSRPDETRSHDDPVVLGKRFRPRLPVNMTAKVIPNNLSVDVLDVSHDGSGMGLLWPQAGQPSGQLTLDLKGSRIEGRLAWTVGSRSGFVPTREGKERILQLLP